MSKKPPNFLYKVIEAGYQLSPEAYNFLLGIPNETAEKIIEKALTKANSVTVNDFLIDQKFLFDLVE
ncbi:hypothetical protein FJY84_09090, partial [Candidatus Bathyarchaeota archaeon]|nr:hypothetical protein [Candidatus Bathyarchaeota archaeon]